ncbi:PAS domain S-box protein [Carboxylicivirga sp. RSCT41]|uniref:sensor histidine kinase n=1 Tax=Carboxylicivirga agarovorans TaxID=3417570 RepID=UPI003D3284B0
MQSGLLKGSNSVKFSAELSAIFENAMVLLVLINDEGKVVNINRTGLDFIGKRKEEVLNRLTGEVFNCNNAWSEEKVVCGFGLNCHHCPLRNCVRDTFETGKSHIREEGSLIVRRDDRDVKLDLLISTSIVTLEGIDYTLLTIDDITRQKQTELALKESQKHYKIINDNLVDVIWSFDLNEQFTYVSPSVMAQRGITVEEALTLSLEEAVGSSNYPQVKEVIDRKLQQIARGDQEGWKPFDFILNYRKEDADVWMEAYGRVIEGDDGRPQMIAGTSRDITRQIIAEQALVQNREQYKFIADNISDTVWTYDLNLNCTYISPSIYNFRGYTVEEALTLSPEDTFHPDHLGKAYEVLNGKLSQIRQGNPMGWEPFVEEFKLLKKDKSYIWAQLSVVFIKGENGQPAMIMGSSRDISKQKEVELALKESQEQYKLINDHISDTLWTSDLEMNVTHVSPSVYNLTGYTVEETMDMNAVHSFHHGDDKNLMESTIKARLSDIEHGNPLGWEPMAFDVKLQKKDKSYIWTQESMSIIKGPDGKPHSIMGTSRNITRQKEASIALEISEQTFKDTFKYSGVGIVLASLEGVFINVNDAACKMLGYSEKDLLCMNFREITHPDDLETNQKALQQLLNDEIKYYHLEKRYITKAGQTIWANLYVTVVRGVDNQPLYLNTQLVDITPRITYQQALIEEKKKIEAKESHYRALFEESYDAVILRKDRKAIACNQAAVDILEYGSKEELLNHRPEDVSPMYQPDGQLSKDKASHYTQLAFKMGRWSFDWLFKTKSGKEKWANVAITRFVVNGEEYSYSIWRDISVRKKQELELRSLSNKLIKAQSLASIGYFELYLGDKHASGSDEYYKIYQIKRPRHTRRDFLDVVCPEDRERVMAIQDKAQNGDGSYDMKYRIKTPAGIYKHIHEIGEFKFDGNGTPYYLLGMVHDITKEREAELKLLESENKLRTIFDTAQVGIMHNKNRHTIFSNNYLCNLLGYTNDELLNKDTSMFYTSYEEFIAVGKRINRKLLSGKSIFQETIFRKKDGLLINVLIKSSYYNGMDDSDGIISVITDITKLKTIEQELKQTNVEKDKFFSIIAHDLKGPFHALFGLSDLLVSNYQEYDEKTKLELISHINRDLETTYKLLENLLTWTRSRSGRIEYRPTVINAKDFIEDGIEILESSIRKKEISIITDIDTHAHIYADKETMNTVLRNLLSNAVKFTHKKGKVIISSELLEGQNNKRYLAISVTDNGVGIPEGLIEDLFKINVNTTSQGTDNESGTGLGLILCQDFVRKNGGEIKVESMEGQGSAFTFTVPVCN